MIEYRVMLPGDIEAGLQLCRSSGWNQLARDWQIFLQLDPLSSRVAVDGKKVVGTVTTVRYGHLFSWIGMVLVDPGSQRQGIGMNLLGQALHILGNEETVKLDATPAGREVYLKLGFTDEYGLSRMINHAVPQLSGSLAVRPMLKQDIALAAKLDKEVFGADRQQLLEWMWEGAPQFAFITGQQNTLSGFCMGRTGHRYSHIGPVVAENVMHAIQLVSAALQRCTGTQVILDASHCEPGWIAWLKEIGFSVQRPFMRMYRGSNRSLGIPGKQFGILGPEFG